MRSLAEPMDPVGHCSLNLSRSHDHARIRNHRVMDDKTLLLGFRARTQSRGLTYRNPQTYITVCHTAEKPLLQSPSGEAFFLLAPEHTSPASPPRFFIPCRMVGLGCRVEDSAESLLSNSPGQPPNPPLSSGLVRNFLGHWATPDIGLSTLSHR
jgi:hypothetical protein